MKIDHKILGYRMNIEELRGRKDPQALKAVAREMEALFAHEMIKAMRETAKISTGSGLGGDMYMSMFDLELARLMSERGLGLQDMLLKDLRKNLPQEAGSPGPSESINETEQAGATPPQGASAPAPRTRMKRETGPAEASPGLESMPVSGTVTSGFGLRRHPVHGDVRFHRGIDIAAPAGTNIYPAGSGTVVFSGEQPGYGNLVVISHGDGLLTKYGHNSVNLVKAGDVVDASTVIGRVGSTGRSTGPHLHFEAAQDGRSVNPVTLIAQKWPKVSPKIDDKKENVT